MIRSLTGLIALAGLLGLAQSCSQTLTGPPARLPLSDVRDFIWKRPALAAGIDYTVYRQGTSSIHRLMSKDGIRVTDASASAAGFVLQADVDSVLIDSIGSNSIFSPPSGYSFSVPSQKITRQLAVNAVLCADSIVIIATDGGIFRSNDRATWGLSIPNTVSCLAQDSVGDIFAATGDSILRSRNSGATWSLFAIPHASARITALAALHDSSLYVGFEAPWGVVYTENLAKPVQFQPLTAQFETVRAIALNTVSGLVETIVADSNSVSIFHDNFPIYGKTGMHDINCLFLNDTGLCYVGCNQGIAFQEQGFSTTWRMMAAQDQANITGCTAAESGQIRFVSHGGNILQANGGSIAPLGTLRLNARCVASDRSGTLFIGTDAGLSIVTPSGDLVSTAGPTTVTTVEAHSGLTLLHRPEMQSSGTWLAGKLTGPGLPVGIPITARIQDHVDALTVQEDTALSGAATTYGESFVIRYATEQSDGSLLDGIPLYWVVYYARDVGPVRIESYSLQAGKTYSLHDRATLVR